MACTENSAMRNVESMLNTAQKFNGFSILSTFYAAVLCYVRITACLGFAAYATCMVMTIGCMH